MAPSWTYLVVETRRGGAILDLFSCRDTARWRHPGLIPQTRTFLANKLGTLIAALVSEASRNRFMDLCRTRRGNRCDSLEVFVPLYSGGVEVFNTITQVNTNIY